MSGDLDCRSDTSALFDDSDIIPWISAINSAGTLNSISGNYCMCGISDAGSSSCVNLSDDGNAVTGESGTVHSATEDFSVGVHTTTEKLFWDSFPCNPWELPCVEIHRDDQLLVQTTQGCSYLNENISPGNDHVDEVITVSDEEIIVSVAMTRVPCC